MGSLLELGRKLARFLLLALGLLRLFQAEDAAAGLLTGGGLMRVFSHGR